MSAVKLKLESFEKGGVEFELKLCQINVRVGSNFAVVTPEVLVHIWVQLTIKFSMFDLCQLL